MSIYNKIRRAVAKKVVNRKKHLQLKEAIITFTFDDVPETGFTAGLPILQKYGFKSTFYVALGFMDHPVEGGVRYTPEHLKMVVDDQSELACHTYGHIHCYQSSKATIEKDLSKNSQRINEVIPGYRFKNFSYPFGEQTIAAKQVVRNKFRTGRGVNSGINHGQIDLINLHAYQIGTNITPDQGRALIDEAIRLKGWLIFFTHDVQKDHSLYGCTPELLDSVAAYCSEKKCSVLTMDEAISRIEGR
ncbi:MAG: polysaccharide deacetylase family protein [Flavobacteriales bacterium]|nr:polysaccharide deacetylase family protein [Flavobacteriales bacterium]